MSPTIAFEMSDRTLERRSPSPLSPSLSQSGCVRRSTSRSTFSPSSTTSGILRRPGCWGSPSGPAYGTTTPRSAHRAGRRPHDYPRHIRSPDSHMHDCRSLTAIRIQPPTPATGGRRTSDWKSCCQARSGRTLLVRGRRRMWLAYMDESGNTGRDLANPEQRFHMIVTVVFDESQVAAVHAHVRDVAQRHCAGTWCKPDFEFHGHEVFSGEGYFEGRTAPERIQIYDELLAAIGMLGGKVTARGVDKPSLARRYPNPFHPHDITLMFTCESLEHMARTHDSRVLLVADGGTRGGERRATGPRELSAIRHLVGVAGTAHRPHHRHHPLRPFRDQPGDTACGLHRVHGR